MSLFPLRKPSTRAFFKEADTMGMGRIDRFHSYVYGRWPYFYISFGLGRHPLSRWLGRPLVGLFRFLMRLGGHPEPTGPGFARTYHGKAMPLDAARKLIQVDREISVENLEHVIPFPVARDLILKDPGHIVLLDCPCRASVKNPCLPLDVCLIVGEPFASFMAEHHPRRSRRIGVAEAVRVLEEEHARGHVHHAFFKDAMLGRYYAICSCCSCCCGAMQAQRNGTPMLISSGYVAECDPVACVGCGLCQERCQLSAISVIKKKGMHIDPALCLGCGVCVSTCPKDAMRLKRDPSLPAPLDIEEFLASENTAIS